MKKLLLILSQFLSLIALSQPIESIELVNVADGKMTAIRPCSTCKGSVVIFTSLSCPYDQHYQDRIKALIEKFGTDVSFFLVNSNTEPSEDETKMKTALSRWGFSIPYLSDKNQTAMTTLGVRRTPEAVLLKLNGKSLQPVYQGAIDDNPQVHHDTGKDFLKDAIEELITNKSIKVATERVIGCSIRKKG